MNFLKKNEKNSYQIQNMFIKFGRGIYYSVEHLGVNQSSVSC